MTKKLILIISIIAITTGATFAQYQADALLYSQDVYGSTSKSKAMGGALSPVGADLSVMATNPAGLSLLKSSQFLFSSNFLLNKAESKYAGKTRDENTFKYSVNSISGAWVIPLGGSEFKSMTLGLGYNRMNEYSRDIIASGNNNAGSILDYYVYNANQNNNRYSPFRENLAYEAYLLNIDNTTNEYYSHVTDEGVYGEYQRRHQTSIGGKGEADFSFAMNYADLLHFGATVGVQIFNNERRNRFYEADYTKVERLNKSGELVRVDPKDMEFNEKIVTSGFGINLKAGMLITPVDFLRISAAVHTKTLTSFDEEYKTGLSSSFHLPDENNNYSYFQDSDDNFFSWNLHQPMHFNLGTAFVLDQYKVGSIYTLPMTLSFEYEFIDYSTMHLKSSDANADFDRENDLIRDLYRQTHNLRAGLELNMGAVALRGGYAVYPNALAANTGLFENARINYSGGISFAGKFGYIDLAYCFSQSKENLFMYDAGLTYPEDPIGGIKEPIANITNTLQFITITFGIK